MGILWNGMIDIVDWIIPLLLQSVRLRRGSKFIHLRRGFSSGESVSRLDSNLSWVYSPLNPTVGLDDSQFLFQCADASDTRDSGALDQWMDRWEGTAAQRLPSVLRLPELTSALLADLQDSRVFFRLSLRGDHEMATLIGIWLVVGPPLWKIWKSIGMIVPNIWEKNVPNHQPVMIHLEICRVSDFQTSWWHHGTMFSLLAQSRRFLLSHDEVWVCWCLQFLGYNMGHFQ